MKDKTIYIEKIRIFAILMVLFNHTNLHGFMGYTSTDNQIEYILSMLFSIICKSAVPLFFMVSGFLLIGRTDSFKSLLKKRIFRYLVIIAVASSFTYLISNLLNHEAISIRNLIKCIYRGDIDTYWFLYAYLAVILILPIFQSLKSVFSPELIRYLIILQYIFFGFLPSVELLFLNQYINPGISPYLLASGYFYFLIGYYYGTNDDSFFKDFKSKKSFLAMFLSVIFSCIMIIVEHQKTGEFSERFLTAFLPYIVIFIFLCFKSTESHNSFLDKTILFLGDKTFGIYLLEPILRLCLKPVYVSLINFKYSNLLGSIIWVIFAFIIGATITFFIKLIPPVKKYI